MTFSGLALTWTFFLGACVSLPLPSPPTSYTDAEARSVARRARIVVSRRQPRTEDQILAALSLERRRLFEPSSGSENMLLWRTYSISPHYELWLTCSFQQPPDTYSGAFVRRPDPERRFYPPR